jgi:hypothetical protein
MIIKVIDDVEKQFKEFFQSTVSFNINQKVIKKGKLINVTVKDFFITFILEITKGGVKTFEIPYPYDIIKIKDGLLFDYTLNTLTHDDAYKFVKAKNFTPKKNSKFYDVKMTLIQL